MKIIFSFIALCSFLMAGQAFCQKFNGYHYQIKIYHLKGKTQESRVDQYLQNAYLPALHRAGIPDVGVFKPVTADTAEQLIYVWIPFKKIDQFTTLDDKLRQDKTYLSTGRDYLNAAYNDIPYLRIESILLQAFAGMPSPKNPQLIGSKSERIYELRSYESQTEQISMNKITMFNDAEISIFSNLQFNAVFYGQVISGSHMPNLMYLTTFNNKEDRDRHWAAFGTEYKKISTLPKYQNNTSKISILFLHPVSYSDI